MTKTQLKFLAKRQKRKLIWSLVVFLISSVLSVASAYVVKKGDTLSSIAAKHLGKPIYGSRGNLKKILARNSQIKNPDLIFIGQAIDIDGANLSRSAATVEAAPKVQTNEAIAAEKTEHSTEQTHSKAFLGHGIFSIIPEFNSTKIVGTDRASGAKATLVSTSNYGATTSYSHVWSNTLQTAFFFGLSKLSIKEPSSGGALTNSKPSLYSFGATAKYQFSPKLSLQTGVGLYQRAYLKAISATTVALDPLSVPSFGVLGSYDFLHRNPFTMGLSLGAGVDLPASEGAYKTRLNPNYQSAVYVKHAISSHFQTEVGLRACYLTENTSIAKQSQTDLGIYLRVGFVFGEGTK